MEDIDIVTWTPGNPNDRSVTGFRIRHGGPRAPMSRRFYQVMQQRGLGPRETIINNKTIITAADEAAWEAARANPTGTEAKLIEAVKAMRHRRAKLAGAAAAKSARHVSKRGRRKQK